MALYVAHQVDSHIREGIVIRAKNQRDAQAIVNKWESVYGGTWRVSALREHSGKPGVVAGFGNWMARHADPGFVEV